jgi:protein-S-isoprenylcysteine O-methyltransferase Ste14
MEFIPEFHFGWSNGWLYLLLLAATDGLLFALFPRDVVKRLFDRSGWSKRQIVLTVVGKLFALAAIAMLVFTPLKLGSAVFAIGSIIALLALLGLIKSLYDYRNTPMDTLVTEGLYKLSRHPQIMMSFLVLLGASIAIGSWSALLLLVLARILSHQQLLAEEEACIRQYGEAYRAYQRTTPRYFLFF